MADKIPEIGKTPVGETAAGQISIDQFIALNDELAALVRAGLPLERGLRELGRDIPGSLGDTVQILATRLSHGETLPQALAAERDRFPGVYRAVVEAGLKAGRLSVAVEGLASFARSYAELRRAIGMALLYPLIVLTLAWGLLLFFALEIVPKFLEAYSVFRLPTHAIVERLRESVPYWGPLPPALLLLVGLWWIRSGRVMILQPKWARRSLGWIPWMRGILANARSASFSELLALLVEHEVPLPEAIVLAAEATADDAMIAGAREVAASVERGESVSDVIGAARVFPPMLRWLMITGLTRGVLAKALRHAGHTYRELSIHDASVVKQLLPVAALLAVGATSAFVYCLSVFEPFMALVYELSVF
jgi:general secretion pathway protein F